MKRTMAIWLALVMSIGLVASGATSAQADPAGWSLKAGQFLVTTPDGEVGPASVVKGKAPTGKVVKGIWDGKATVASKSLVSCPSACFFYGTGQQGYTAAGSGVGQGSSLIQANLTVETPAVCSGDGAHSLAEIAMTTGAPGSRNIVEIGWTVDPAINGGSSAPYLFVHEWRNELPMGYNGTGSSTFVDYAPTTLNAGQPMPVAGGASKQFAIQYFGGNWWTQYDTQWIGYFPGTNWSSYSPPQTFTNATSNYGQGFGELAAWNTTPRSDMGNALLGTNTSSARVGSWSMLDATGAAYTFNFSPFHQGGQSVISTAYAAALRAGSVRTGGYGGPGYNLAGTAAGAAGC
jgi:neprosin-like protein